MTDQLKDAYGLSTDSDAQGGASPKTNLRSKSREKNSIPGSSSSSELACKEMYHRVQNTLQTLVSYLNVVHTDRSGVEKEATTKLIRFIHLLNCFQIQSLEQINQGLDKIRFDQIIEKTADLFVDQISIEIAKLPKFVGTYKNVTAFAMILYELLDNAVKHGVRPIKIELIIEGPGRGTLQVSNRSKSENAASTDCADGGGRKLIKLLSAGHLPGPVKVEALQKPDGETWITMFIPLDIFGEERAAVSSLGTAVDVADEHTQ